MTPLPKRRHSKGRTHRRRSHDALVAHSIAECPSCHQMHLTHHVCPKCGSYNGRVVVKVKAAE
jgi:large subunit ribosomal protein L32